MSIVFKGIKVSFFVTFSNQLSEIMMNNNIHKLINDSPLGIQHLPQYQMQPTPFTTSLDSKICVKLSASTF